jgi:multidrug transporter EmrE-like cation transporter
MSIAEIFGNRSIQNYSQSKKMRDLILGLLGYVVVIYFLYKSFGQGNMMWVSTMWQGMIIVLGSAFAYFYIGERFTHPLQYVGVVLGLLAMFCVSYGDSKVH